MEQYKLVQDADGTVRILGDAGRSVARMDERHKANREIDGKSLVRQMNSHGPMRAAISQMLDAWSFISNGNQPYQVRNAIKALRDAADLDDKEATLETL